MIADAGFADRLVCATCSHFCTAERQYRAPLELGTQRTPTAQWTVTGAGGYLSYALGLEMMDDIGAMVSIRGDFAGNPWVSACGSVKDKLSFMRGRIDSVYTYLDAPVEDAYSNQAGGTNELGALFIGFGTGSACHEYTVRPGAFDDAFLAESVSRAADRLSTWMFGEEEEEAAPPVDPLSIK